MKILFWAAQEKGHFEDPDFKKDCHYSRMSKNYGKEENHKALDDVPGVSSVGWNPLFCTQ